VQSSATVQHDLYAGRHGRHWQSCDGGWWLLHASSTLDGTQIVVYVTWDQLKNSMVIPLQLLEGAHAAAADGTALRTCPTSKHHSLHSPLVSHVFCAVQRAEKPPTAPGRQDALHVLPTITPEQPAQSWAFLGFPGVGLLAQVLGPGIAAAAHRLQPAGLSVVIGWDGNRHGAA
jgi:hypothetical protein